MVKKLGLKLKEQKGFTLIELLAVIVILGIIAAIAIPAISGVINKSDKKAAAQEGIAIINAAKMYVAEHPDEVKADFEGTGTGLAGDGMLKFADLGEYLDHVKDDGFDIILGRATTTGKYSYSIENHISNKKLDDTNIDEQGLINAAK